MMSNTIRAFYNYSSFGDSIGICHNEIYDEIEITIPDGEGIEPYETESGEIAYKVPCGLCFWLYELFMVRADGEIWMDYIDTDGKRHKRKCSYKKIS